MLPPVLLVHGLASSFEHGWRKPGWADLLADAGREVVGLDLPGHGGAALDGDDPAGALRRAVAGAAEPHPLLDAVGFSLGARLLLELAAREPARFRKIVVIGAGANLFRDDTMGFLAGVFEAGATDPEDVLGTLFLRLARTAGNDPAVLARLLRGGPPPLDPAALATLACPVLVVIGDRDFAGPADPLLEALPDAELALLRGVDHFGAPADFGCLSRALAFLDAEPA